MQFSQLPNCLKILLLAWSKLPLWFLHSLGYTLGGVFYILGFCLPKKRARFIKTMQECGVDNPEKCFRFYHRVIFSLLFDFPWWWLQKDKNTRSHINITGDISLLDKYIGKESTIWVAGHLGSTEAIFRLLSQYGDVVFLYHGPKNKLSEKILSLRKQPPKFTALNHKLLSTPKNMLKALAQKKPVIIYTDLRPHKGYGEWISFFNRPAYTSTLAGRLSKVSGVRVIYFECHHRFAGYNIHLKEITDMMVGDTNNRNQVINDCIEKSVRQKPEQYMWLTKRFLAP